jgi:hypothetical protein
MNCARPCFWFMLKTPILEKLLTNYSTLDGRGVRKAAS